MSDEENSLYGDAYLSHEYKPSFRYHLIQKKDLQNVQSISYPKKFSI